MRRGHGKIPVAVGLMRRAAGFLEEENEVDVAVRLKSLVSDVLRNRPLAANEEMTPLQACLMAAIPLSDEVDPDHI